MGKQHGTPSHFLLLRLAPPSGQGGESTLLRLNTSEETCTARLRGYTAFANVAPLSAYPLSERAALLRGASMLSHTALPY